MLCHLLYTAVFSGYIRQRCLTVVIRQIFCGQIIRRKSTSCEAFAIHNRKSIEMHNRNGKTIQALRSGDLLVQVSSAAQSRSISKLDKIADRPVTVLHSI